jgi:hypothetical protein
MRDVTRGSRAEWRIGYGRELVADNRNFLERRVDDLMLGLIVGRTRQQMHGERTLKALAEICEATKDEWLPWEIEWSDEHE